MDGFDDLEDRYYSAFTAAVYESGGLKKQADFANLFPRFAQNDVCDVLSCAVYSSDQWGDLLLLLVMAAKGESNDAELADIAQRIIRLAVSHWASWAAKTHMRDNE